MKVRRPARRSGRVSGITLPALAPVETRENYNTRYMSYVPHLKKQDTRILNHITTNQFLTRMMLNGRLNCGLIATYIMLVHYNNKARWSHDFQCPTPGACKFLGIHRDTWNKQVKELMKIGMIDRVHTSKNPNEASWYTLMTPDFVNFVKEKFKNNIDRVGGHAD